MIAVLVLAGLSLLHVTFGGTPCPPREDIYPCVCTAVPLQKKAIFTVVTCRHVPHSGALDSAYPSLRPMEIDRFVMVDCFLEADKLGSEKEKNQKLANNWWTDFRIRELEILDSELSAGFACETSARCKNSHQTHVSIVNSSRTESIQTVCEVSKGEKFSWVSCLSRLKRFEFRGNQLTELKKTFFPMILPYLEDVNVSRNAIRTVESGAFAKLPRLTSLDLSHNEIQSIPSGIFASSETKLKFLDLSFNHLSTLPADMHTLTPTLEILNLRRNVISKLEEDEWKSMPKKSLRQVDLRENVITCDCYLIWFNASLPVHTAILGTCSTPEEYENTNVRRASILLSSRCNATGETIMQDI